ncbi:MAG: Ig-like domain-containing protein, partial [Spirochaetia bacterium]|nr:Ig-like domain-containing protein [Spirochaetia bacterium]
MKYSVLKNIFISLVLVLWNAASLYADGLEVLQAAPTGEVEEIEYTSEIKIVFSKPMVPLARLSQSVQVPEVAIAPALAGEFRWSGTDTLLFKFARRLPKATSFKVTVSGKMSAVSGDKLGDDYSFEFQTPRPRVVSVMPDDRRNEVSLIANVVL